MLTLNCCLNVRKVGLLLSKVSLRTTYSTLQSPALTTNDR